jgi:Sec-independent protein translocase protein TatA
MNLGLGQIVIILILLALLWGNFPQLFKNIVSNIHEVFDKSLADQSEESNKKKDSNKD